MEISGIGFENFRVFKDRCDFDLAPITVLTGANSSGKSTVIKALKLFQHFWENKERFYQLDFIENSHQHQLGDFETSLSKHSDNKDSFVVRYLFDDLCVENEFVKDTNNKLKNGRLIQSRIIQNNADNRKLLYATINEKNAYIYYYYDYEEIIKMSLFYDFFENNCYKYLFNTKIIELITQIDVNNYDEFEVVLWTLIIKKYPYMTTKFDYNAFMKIINEIENDYPERWNENNFGQYKGESIGVFKGESIWRTIIKKEIVKNFKNFQDFFKDLEKQFIKDYSILTGDIYDYVDWDVNVKLHFPNIDDFRCYSWPYPRTYTDKLVLFNLIFHYVLGIEKHLFEIKDEKNKSQMELSLFDWHAYVMNPYKEIESFSKNIHFVESIRANTQRLYTFSTQGTSFNDFLLEYMRNEYDKKFCNKWIKEFCIGETFDCEFDAGVGIKIIIDKGIEGKETNLVDLGYGVTQYLPILMHIIYCANKGKTTIVIEEPETNLHPKFQSKLADLFVDAKKTFGISFIIETHSEYLIRKLQYLTAKGEIKPDDTVIHYIGSPNPDEREYGEEQVRTIRIKPNGQLSKPFGSGFTDESSHWIKEMFTLSNQN